MVAVDARTILRATGCDLKKLPLGAREAFFLMQLDGQLTLEEIASVSGMNIGEASAIASRLVRLGAVSLLDPITLRRGAKLSTVHGTPRVERPSPRVDPRAEEPSVRMFHLSPAARGNGALPPAPRGFRIDPRAEGASVAPESRKRSVAPGRGPNRSVR